MLWLRCQMLVAVALLGYLAGGAFGSEAPRYQKTDYTPFGPQIQRLLGIPDGPNEWHDDLLQVCLPLRDIRRLGGGLNWEPDHVKLNSAEIAQIDGVAKRILTQARAGDLIDAILGMGHVHLDFDKRATLAPEPMGLQILGFIMIRHALEQRAQDPELASRWVRAATFITSCNELSSDGIYLYRIKVSVAPLDDLPNLLRVDFRRARQIVGAADEAQARAEFGSPDSRLFQSVVFFGDTMMRSIGYRRPITDEDFDKMLECLREAWIEAGRKSSYAGRCTIAKGAWTLKCLAEARREPGRPQRVAQLMRELQEKHARNVHEKRWLEQAASEPGPEPRYSPLGIITGPYSPFHRFRPPE